jgi:hypothetical protein
MASTLSLSRLLLPLAGALTLAGCSQTNSLPSTPVDRPSNAADSMRPEAKGGDLLYVADQDTNDVYVYSWPQGKLAQTLTGFTGASNLCSDSSGNVYVPDYFSHDVLEYAHGGSTPIRTLKAPGENPYSCAVDPATGNLAVANITSATSGPGDLLVYAKAKGRPKSYHAAGFVAFNSCSYDGSGNLFVDGYAATYAFRFAELQKGKSALTNIAVRQFINNPGGVLWDGKYITVGDAADGWIYEVSVSGKTGKIEGSTLLRHSANVFQYWFYGKSVLATNITSFSAPSGYVGVWKYPEGGKPTATIKGFSKPDGVTISVASRR